MSSLIDIFFCFTNSSGRPSSVVPGGGDADPVLVRDRLEHLLDEESIRRLELAKHRPGIAHARRHATMLPPSGQRSRGQYRDDAPSPSESDGARARVRACASPCRCMRPGSACHVAAVVLIPSDAARGPSPRSRGSNSSVVYEGRAHIFLGASVDQLVRRACLVEREAMGDQPVRLELPGCEQLGGERARARSRPARLPRR